MQIEKEKRHAVPLCDGGCISIWTFVFFLFSRAGEAGNGAYESVMCVGLYSFYLYFYVNFISGNRDLPSYIFVFWTWKCFSYQPKQVHENEIKTPCNTDHIRLLLAVQRSHYWRPFYLPPFYRSPLPLWMTWRRKWKAEKCGDSIINPCIKLF